MSILITLTIIIGTIGVIIETLPRFYGENYQFWFAFEAIMIALFSLEFTFRSLANSESREQFWSFMGSFYTLVDLLSIIPFFLELAIHGRHIGEFQKFTILRLFRLLRLLRTFQTSILLKMSVEAMIIAVHRSLETLIAIICFLIMVVIVTSTMIYYVERGEYDAIRKVFIDVDGLPSKFDSIPATCWFVVEIVTTVGLGDVYPKTTAGRIITFPVMMFGLLIVALPSIVIGRNFADAWSWLRINRIGVTRHGRRVPDIDEEKRSASPTDTSLEALLVEMKRQNEMLDALLHKSSNLYK